MIHSHRVKRAKLFDTLLYHVLDIPSLRHIANSSACFPAHGFYFLDDFIAGFLEGRNVINTHVVPISGKPEGD